MSTCNSCNVPLGDDESKSRHYASEFHAINAKRRAADLPPITTAGYDRLKDQQAAETKAAEDADAEVVYICEACHKTFYSEGQFATHNSSTRHREKVKEILAARKAARQAEKERAAATAAAVAAGLPPPVAEPEPEPVNEAAAEAEPEEIVISCNHCVFCWQDNKDIESNLRHMQLAHSFFVPDVEYCTELEGLVEYLHAKVIEAKRCLWCTGNKEFESPEAARQHMNDKRHCGMRYEEDADFEEFEQFYEYDTSSDEGDDAGEDGAMMVLPGSDEMAELAGSFGDLPLPGGGVARHRALLRYYKQRYRVPDEKRASLQTATRVALEYSKATQSSGGRDAHLPLSTRFNVGTGVRGNGTDASQQRRVQKAQQHFDLSTGMNKNSIMRRWYRIQAANTLS